MSFRSLLASLGRRAALHCAGAVWALAVCLPAFARAPVEVSAARPVQAIAAQGELLVDASGQLGLAGALAATGWQTPGTASFGFGYTRDHHWVRWTLRNSSAQTVPVVIDLGQPRHDLAHWHVLRSGPDTHGPPVESTLSGDRLPFSQQPLRQRNIALPVTLAPHETLQVVVHLSTHDGLYEALPVTLYTREAFEAAMAREDKLLMLFHGALAALGLYNLLLFFATRERAFGAYTHYIAWFLMWNLTSRGYAWQHLWPDAPAFNNDFLTIATAGTFFCVGRFAILYMRLDEHLSRGWVRAIQVFMGLNVADAALALTGHYALGVMVGWATGLPLGVITLVVAARLAWRGVRPARFYVLAFTLLCVGAAAYIAQIATLAPANWFTTWGIQIGSVAELFLLALGLADLMNTLKAQKLAAERRERQAQQALATRLEGEVAERTQALELANRRLRDLSITDELTGAFNRRHFNDFCAQLLAHGPRDEPLAFCMFDLDRFKDFNDRLGHQAGDEALRAVAVAVQTELRRSGDLLFRLGGEEFGVLFSARSAEHAHAFVERIRQAVRALHIEHPAHPEGLVTASFGVVWWGVQPPAGLTRDELYSRADRQLYAAKEAGRDRVVLQAM